MKFKKFLIEILATYFYIGYLPSAGTLATLASFPLVFLFDKLSFLIKLVIIILFLSVSVYISSLAEKNFCNKDDRRIVIDEVVGFLISMFNIRLSFLNLMMGFFIFRFLDIFKIFGFKKLQKLPSGWGILIDDIFAGILTNISLKLILFLL
ncbi:MAG: phosphatidylglycerophosphatase A [Elusimicrobiota bacterium]|nr:phosphatidylglycerophosphatase A [Endomicrobiia bacterium]MDW8165867.1 phosphatidylglycerophosphatase A [Elusimicrobiota bacterium]